MTTVELEDLEGNTYKETIPKYISSRLVNQCEAVFNGAVRATGGGQEKAEITNPSEALAKQKNMVLEWINEHRLEADLPPEKLAPPSKDKILVEYAEYIRGMEINKKKGSQKSRTTDESDNE